MNFPLLTGPLDLATYGDGVSINVPSGQPGDDKEYPLVNITFPSLETASAVSLSGNISRFGLP